MVNFTHYYNLPEKWEDDVWQILCECDNEFCPPLSARGGTNHTNFEEKYEADKPILYFHNIRQQAIIIASKDDDVLGFLSYIQKDKHNYVSTVCVKTEYRKHGIAKKLYEKMDEISETEGKDRLVIRTWSTNEANMHILRSMGYKEVEVLENDRGKGIDTVYFEKVLVKI